MIEMVPSLATRLDREGVPVCAGRSGFTASHQFAVKAAQYRGGQTASKTLRKAGIPPCGIGLPKPAVPDDTNGLRIRTLEVVRWGMTLADAAQLASFIARGLAGEEIAGQVSEWQRGFLKLHFVHS